MVVQDHPQKKRYSIVKPSVRSAVKNLTKLGRHYQNGEGEIVRVDSIEEVLLYASDDCRKRNPHLVKEMGKKPPKKTKMGNVKTEVDGIIFDSKHEANYYGELMLMKKAGVIKDFERQVYFTLIDGFEREVNGKTEKRQPIRIKVDFVVTFPEGNIEVHDPKGHKTKEYKMKKKMFEGRYPDIPFIEI